jgi:hypothetical protein
MIERDLKVMQNFGGETLWKTLIWKTHTDMGGIILIEISWRQAVRTCIYLFICFI